MLVLVEDVLLAKMPLTVPVVKNALISVVLLLVMLVPHVHKDSTAKQIHKIVYLASMTVIADLAAQHAKEIASLKKSNAVWIINVKRLFVNVLSEQLAIKKVVSANPINLVPVEKNLGQMETVPNHADLRSVPPEKLQTLKINALVSLKKVGVSLVQEMPNVASMDTVLKTPIKINFVQKIARPPAPAQIILSMVV